MHYYNANIRIQIIKKKNAHALHITNTMLINKSPIYIYIGDKGQAVKITFKRE